MSLKSALSVSAGAASVLPDPAIISVFGLVFSLNMTQRYIYLILIMKDFNLFLFNFTYIYNFFFF